MMMNNTIIEGHIYNMKTRGYTVFPKYLSKTMSEKLKKQLVADLAKYDPQQYDSERSVLDRHHLHDLMCRDISYAKLLEDERLQQILAPLLGEFWTMYAFTSSSAAPGSTNYGGRVHVDSPRWIEGYPTNIGVLWALDEFTVNNGGTKVLPGSHHADMIPTQEYFDENAVQVECPQGSMIVFDARVVHSTGFNATKQWRHALTLNACRSYMKQRMDWPQFIPAVISDELNLQARRIIGFDTRVPKSLEELFVPPEERLYKANQG